MASRTISHLENIITGRRTNLNIGTHSNYRLTIKRPRVRSIRIFFRTLLIHKLKRDSSITLNRPARSRLHSKLTVCLTGLNRNKVKRRILRTLPRQDPYFLDRTPLSRILTDFSLLIRQVDLSLVNRQNSLVRNSRINRAIQVRITRTSNTSRTILMRLFRYAPHTMNVKGQLIRWRRVRVINTGLLRKRVSKPRHILVTMVTSPSLNDRRRVLAVSAKVLSSLTSFNLIRMQLYNISVTMPNLSNLTRTTEDVILTSLRSTMSSLQGLGAINGFRMFRYFSFRGFINVRYQRMYHSSPRSGVQ